MVSPTPILHVRVGRIGARENWYNIVSGISFHDMFTWFTYQTILLYDIY